MANFKVVISDPKSKKAFQKEIEQKASGFMGKSIGERVRGDAMGFSGYEFQVTGGSDAQGFPMRKDVGGIGRKRLLLSAGTGFHPKVRGQRKRKSIRGGTISSAISQINVKVVTHGSKPMEELSAKKEKKKELSEEEKKAALQKELSQMEDTKAPEKSRSDQILEEMNAKEEAGKAGKPAEEKKAEDKEGAADKKAAEGDKEAKPGKEEDSEGKAAGEEPKKEESKESEKEKKD